ncbi:dihydrolipoyl dehydrogenase [Paraherbaspirillum soli]|uniref:Dihydrolipoyl dehydrogenase n=1 Tax=Paraherbaspirillum soli TaxID=631222 RepID=A0ABW0M8C6_9BURK
MDNLTVDVAVIGVGTAGLAAYRAAKKQGRHAILIEGGPYGTTCARVGCMPSKLLIAAADAAQTIRRAPAFGVHPGPLRIDGRQVMARVRTERDRFVGFVLDGVDKIPVADRLRGHARFIDPRRLQIGDHTTVTAGRIVIATGSSPSIPEQLQHLGKHVVVNDDVFDWDDLPESVAVVGTGVVGLELGQALHRLGVRVAIFGRSNRIAQLTDPVVLESATACFSDELDLRLNTHIVSAQLQDQQVALHTRSADGSERVERFALILAAAGRSPNVAQLSLENTGLELDQQGIPTFDPATMQCGDSAIFIAGDVNLQRPVLHEANVQGIEAGKNAALYPDPESAADRVRFSIVFSEPQIAMIGQSYRTLESTGPGTFAIGAVSFQDQGRSRIMLQNHGTLRVYAEHGSGRLLGAELAGPRAEHLAHLLAWACQSKMTISDMLALPFYHPVVEEGLRTALRDAQYQLTHASTSDDMSIVGR